MLVHHVARQDAVDGAYAHVAALVRVECPVAAQPVAQQVVALLADVWAVTALGTHQHQANPLVHRVEYKALCVPASFLLLFCNRALHC